MSNTSGQATANIDQTIDTKRKVVWSTQSSAMNLHSALVFASIVAAVAAAIVESENVTEAIASSSGTNDGFLCDFPTAGCANGMFNQVLCACECIPPFCPDAFGTCAVSGACDDPWIECVRGENCPWWPNPVKAESCTTGPVVSSFLRMCRVSNLV